MTSTMTSNGLSALGEPRRMRGAQLLADPLCNKGTAFTDRERDMLGLRGLLPPRVFTLEEQVQRSLSAVRRKPEPIEKYIYLTNLQNRNEVLFYRLVADHIEEMVPLIYTPTVGQACLEYGSIYRRPRGLFISLKDRGHIQKTREKGREITDSMLAMIKKLPCKAEAAELAFFGEIMAKREF